MARAHSGTSDRFSYRGELEPSVRTLEGTLTQYWLDPAGQFVQVAQVIGFRSIKRARPHKATRNG